MKTLEEIAASLATIPGEANVTAVKEQLAEERTVREALERKLAQLEDALSQTKHALSQIIYKDIDHDGLGTISDHVNSAPPSGSYSNSQHHSHKEETGPSTAKQQSRTQDL